jgi:[ribosomal protein S5]-alanine N-acetyltransferase
METRRDPAEAEASAPAWRLETARLRITTWQSDDLATARKLWGDPLVMRYIDSRGGLDDDQVADKLRQEIERERRDGVQYWKLMLKATAEAVGCCGLRPRDAPHGSYELGFHLVSAHWGRGFASEAATEVVRHAFDGMRLPMLMAGHHPENVASRAVLLKLGFRYVGDELYRPTGLYHPLYELRPQATNPQSRPTTRADT